MLIRPLTLLAAVTSLALFSTPCHAQSPANTTVLAPTQDPRCSQHRLRDACDASQPFSATSRCQWRFGACVRAAYCSPADCSGTPNPNCDQCASFGNWCRSKPIGCPMPCDRITVQTDCQMWASTNNGVPSCLWRAGKCVLMNPWAAAVQRPAAPQPTQETRAPVTLGGGNAPPETGLSTTGNTNKNNSNSGDTAGGSPSKGTTQSTQQNDQYVLNNPMLAPGILGGVAVVAVAGLVYITRPNHPATAAGQSTSNLVVAPKPLTPTTRPPPPLKKPAVRNNLQLHGNRSPRPSASTPGLSPLSHPSNNPLLPSSAAGARHGVVRQPSSLRLGVSADGTEVRVSPTSPKSALGSPLVSPLASPSLTPGVVATKSVDGKLTVSLAPSAGGSMSPRLSPMLSPTLTALATRAADGKLTVTLAGSAPASPPLSALPSPTMAGPWTYSQAHCAEAVVAPVTTTTTSNAPISTPPPSAARQHNHSIPSHLSVSPRADRVSFTPEMPASQLQSPLQSQSILVSPTSLTPSPASSLMMQALMDDLNAVAAQNSPPVLVRQGSQASSVNAPGAPIRGTSALAAKPSHF